VTEATTERPLRPRPALTQDNAFFFEGARQGKLLIQRCGSCGTLRHPPRPACVVCRSFEWDTVEATGRGTVYSYVVVHHPQVPAFDYPLPIAVVELEEGTRLVADLVGVAPEAVTIGMPVVVDFVAVDDELTLPMFRPT
jgi:3-oxo-4,17-pregnadiene-20-carboxyl-CoA hydratase alpha subunit